MSPYLITGGEGFIGGKIVQETGGVSYDIKSGKDILDKNLLEKSVQETGGDAGAKGIKGIFHCAAKISVPESVSKPEEYYRNNVEGMRNVVEAAESAGAKIIFSSSAAVYGETSTTVNEDSPLNAKSPYAENKIDGEKMLRGTSLPHIALRYFNVYGPGQSPQYAGVITAFILNALAGKDLTIFGDGNQVRDFVFVSDIVRANILAMNHPNEAFEFFNIGSGTETTIKKLAETIIALTGSKSKITYEAPRPGDIIYSRADVSKAEKVLKWKASVTLEDGLRETISFYSKTL